ncbi:TetR family transcriptional regulator [Mycobacterium sp. TNTM28]|uniref:TetR family transcriptional regulator n=1 Tax=[Mycobacterium] fortunisiensis TaxID=2600579 RepID=A0ABS6KJ06_9MYCO|nr:TetR/AcrR family transcriptional regulator [[Mycobacterium] fortunisiensis]MBU9763575.1 TetR family transcriptional regulator [[Mycobacterium] fortunisiensis]
MSRWEPNARGRLEQAALELYAERGFDQTTVADIAQRAGLTERTYFRHFADKREVLFSGQDALTELLAHTIEQAPAGVAPLAVVGRALSAFGAVLDGRRDHARRRQDIVDANPSLQERELIKLALLTDAMAHALVRRGVAAPAAHLAAEVGMAVFKVAFERWVRADTTDGLTTVVETTLAELPGLQD